MYQHKLRICDVCLLGKITCLGYFHVLGCCWFRLWILGVLLLQVVLMHRLVSCDVCLGVGCSCMWGSCCTALAAHLLQCVLTIGHVAPARLQLLVGGGSCFFAIALHVCIHRMFILA